MAEERRFGWRSRQRSEIERRSAEIEQLEPYVQLAREIQLEVGRLAADETAADAHSLAEAIGAIPRDAREQMTRSIFERLPPEVQWAVLERVFGDDEIREHLTAEHEALRTELALDDLRRRIAAAARASGRLDIAAIPPDEQVTLGLFREADARAAVPRGQRSDTCARQLVLRSGTEGLRVVEDVFNPRGGLFVTREYDEQTWRGERLDAHQAVQVGAIHDSRGGQTFEPALYPAGRVDFSIESGYLRGVLHLGFVILGPVDVFSA